MKTEIRENKKQTAEERAYARKASQYTAHVAGIVTEKRYDAHESALAIAGDLKYQNALQKKVAHLTDAKHVVLVGIGGSSLAVEALYEAQKHLTTKKLHVLDAIEPQALDTIDALMAESRDLNACAYVIVSKSGTTTETLVNAAALIERGVARFGDAFYSRVVMIGGEHSALLARAKKKKVTTITFPESIGGRYSVFTAVGMVPLFLLGIDTKAIIAGARNALAEEGVALIRNRVVALASAARGGAHTVNFFTFDAALIKMGEWYRQLLAESIGKPKTRKKKLFSHALLPVVSSSVDLHSLAQLYLGGYAGVYTHFVQVAVDSQSAPVNHPWFFADVPALVGKTPEEVKRAIHDGVTAAYREAALPYMETTLDGRTAYELGVFMASAMLEVMCLAHVFDVDAFDQPHVELYKSHTRAILRGS